MACYAKQDSTVLDQKTAVPWRGFIIALIIVPLHTAYLVYGEIVLRVASSSASLVPSVLAIVLLIAVANRLFEKWCPRLKLSTADLFVLYTALTLSSILTGFDFLQLLPHSLLFADYYQEVLNPLWTLKDLLPGWFRPTDPGLASSFFRGGEPLSNWRIWIEWFPAVVIWMGFIMALLVTMLSLNYLFLEQWFQRERLSFPLLELPLTLIQEKPRRVLLASRTFWLSFLVVFAVLSSNALSHVFPVLPSIQIDLNNVGRSFGVPFSGCAPFYLSWSPFAVGILYFVPADVLFSCWFFFILRKFMEVIGVVCGWRMPDAGNASGVFPYVRELVQGAWIGLSLVLMWSVRNYVAEAWKRAFPPQSNSGDRGYRLAFIGILAGFIYLVAFEWIAGMRLWVAAFYFCLFFLSTVVMTRIFAQVGAPVTDFYFFNVENLFLSVTGTQSLHPSDIVLLGQCYWFNHGYRQHPMGHQLAALRMAQTLGARSSIAVVTLFVSAILGVLVGLAVMIGVYHSFGAASAKVNNAQLFVGGWEIWNRIISWSQNPAPPKGDQLLLLLLGGVIPAVLAALGQVWIQSPFRPIGFVFAFSYALDYNWNLFFVAWLVKSFALRFGGLRFYRQLAPAFLGMVLADSLAQVLYGMLSASTGIALPVYLGPKW